MNPSYDNSFDSFGAGGAVPGGFFSSPVNNDIILNGSQKKSKKGLIIAAIVGVVVLVIIGIIVLLQRNNTVSVNNSAKEMFYNYANYLLYREDSSAEVTGEYNIDETYALYSVESASDSARKAFFLNAENKLNGFENSLGGDVDQTFMDKFNKYKENFVLTKLTLTNPTIDDSAFVNAYLTLDADGVKNWINDRFANFTSSDYELVKSYGEKGIRYYTLYATHLDEAKMAGCIDGSNQFVVCDFEENEELAEQMSNVYDEMIEMQSESLDETVMGCFDLIQLMNGKQVEEGGES